VDYTHTGICDAASGRLDFRWPREWERGDLPRDDAAALWLAEHDPTARPARNLQTPQTPHASRRRHAGVLPITWAEWMRGNRAIERAKRRARRGINRAQ
jgi:hypothetical protein